MYGSIHFFDTYDPQVDNFEQLQYSLRYFNITGDFSVYFLYNYHPSPNVINHHYWDGDSFEDSIVGKGFSVGNASGTIIWADIPIAAFNVSETVAYYAETQFGNFMEYEKYPSWHMDYCPDEFSEYRILGGGAIPGYSIFILISSVIGVSIFVLKKKIK